MSYPVIDVCILNWFLYIGGKNHFNRFGWQSCKTKSSLWNTEFGKEIKDDVIEQLLLMAEFIFQVFLISKLLFKSWDPNHVRNISLCVAWPNRAFNPHKLGPLNNKDNNRTFQKTTKATKHNQNVMFIFFPLIRNNFTVKCNEAVFCQSQLLCYTLMLPWTTFSLS